jgi:hypothetical protein
MLAEAGQVNAFCNRNNSINIALKNEMTRSFPQPQLFPDLCGGIGINKAWGSRMAAQN